jgi:branched-chain amino acid transport system substrate-binding protein
VIGLFASLFGAAWSRVSGWAALVTALAATDGAFTRHIMPYGPTRFANGQNQAAAPVNTQVQGGDIKVIFPREFADAQAVYPVTG